MINKEINNTIDSVISQINEICSKPIEDLTAIDYEILRLCKIIIEDSEAKK